MTKYLDFCLALREKNNMYYDLTNVLVDVVYMASKEIGEFQVYLDNSFTYNSEVGGYYYYAIDKSKIQSKSVFLKINIDIPTRNKNIVCTRNIEVNKLDECLESLRREIKSSLSNIEGVEDEVKRIYCK